MDIWTYYGITHRDHAICNPLSGAKLEQLVRVLRLKPQSRVLDIASGVGEFLIRVAELYHATGIGVDLSPYFIERARQRLDDLASAAEVEFLRMSGADYRPPEGVRFDMVSCLGASWIYGGYEGTLRALAAMTTPSGLVVSGEPYWVSRPPAAYFDAAGDEAISVASHHDNVLTGDRLGLRLVYTIVSNQDDWDTYQGLQWNAAEAYARAHPDDPDVEALGDRLRLRRDLYLRWERDLLGWAVYVFRI